MVLAFFALPVLESGSVLLVTPFQASFSQGSVNPLLSVPFTAFHSFTGFQCFLDHTYWKVVLLC
jgi:hypothetical protein